VSRWLAALAALGASIWALNRVRAAGWVWLWRKRAHGGDAVRREAGRWLAKWKTSARTPLDERSVQAIADLQRLRFGARATWPEPAAVFLANRRAWREHRRGTATTS
jgi:hypothetical protein